MGFFAENGGFSSKSRERLLNGRAFCVGERERGVGGAEEGQKNGSLRGGDCREEEGRRDFAQGKARGIYFPISKVGAMRLSST